MELKWERTGEGGVLTAPPIFYFQPVPGGCGGLLCGLGTWMAKRFPADLFDRVEAAARRVANHTNASLSVIQAAFPERSQEISQAAQHEQNGKAQAEEQLSREQFANEVELEHEQDRNPQQQALAHFRLFNDCQYERFRLFQNGSHDPSRIPTALDAMTGPKASVLKVLKCKGHRKTLYEAEVRTRENAFRRMTKRVLRVLMMEWAKLGAVFRLQRAVLFFFRLCGRVKVQGTRIAGAEIFCAALQRPSNG